MRRKLLYGMLIVGLAINLVIGAKIYVYALEANPRDDAYPSIKLFTTVLERLRLDYVDGDKVGYQDLIRGALKGMLNTLDPHSEFMEPSKYEDLRKDTEGAFGGVGIVVSIKDNFVTVVSPIEDTPGAKAGILPGDRIMKIDGKSTEKIGLPEAVKRLRGKPGSEVIVTVVRPSTGQTTEHKLVRDEIKIDTAKDLNGKTEFPLSEDKIGYVRLVQFGEHTSTELERALKKLEARGMRALILDLRGNPGGLLDQAVKVCEKFLPKDALVVSTEGRNAAQKMEYRSTRQDLFPKMPMIVLVNNGSASASEIVAGCLQDYKRAIILGEQTFGKGSVQSIIPLMEGSALRLTTAKYYTPSHKVIHEKGISPDIAVVMSEQEEQDMLLKRMPGGIESLDDDLRERVKNATDSQMDRAMDLLRGITLFTKMDSKSPQKKAR